MDIQKIIAIGLLFLAGSVDAKTIQVGGEQARPQDLTNPCQIAPLQPIIFINGVQHGHQPNASVALGLMPNAGGVVCGNCVSAAGPSPSTEKQVDKPENDKPVMVWYKEPKTNKKIIVNGKYNDLDEKGNLQWQKIHSRNRDCVQGSERHCNCISSSGVYVPVILGDNAQKNKGTSIN